MDCPNHTGHGQYWNVTCWCDDDPIVCTSHVRFVPCRKGHVGEFWGVGCVFSTDPYVVAIVGAWHRGEIDE